MAAHYSLNTFLRAAPKDLLAVFFNKNQNFDLGIGDIAAMKKGDIQPIIDALDKLDDGSRKMVEAAFAQVHRLACHAGAKALHQELTAAGIKAPYGKKMKPAALLANALRTRIEHPEAFTSALRFVPFFNQGMYWRKVLGIPGKLPTKDKVQPTADKLADALKTHFLAKEGRGRNCKVEHYGRGGLDFFFAFPEDHAKEQEVWENDELQAQYVNPAFEVAFVYSAEDGGLDTCYAGSGADGRELNEIFGQTMLGVTIPRAVYATPTYDLRPMCKKGFSFVLPVGSGIEYAFVRKLVFTLPNHSGKVTLEMDGDYKTTQGGIYSLITKFFAVSKSHESDKPSFNGVEPIKAEVVVVFKTGDSKKPSRATFSVSTYGSGSCSLKYDEEGLILHEMLRLSGIEALPETDEIDEDSDNEQEQVA